MLTPWKFSPHVTAFRERMTPKVNEIARKAYGADATDWEIDGKLFGMVAFGDPYKYEFLIAMWLHQWPEYFEVEREGFRNEWLVRIAKAVCRYRSVTLCGCASSGKTHTLAAAGYTMWKSNPLNTAFYTSTTSAEAGEARTWGAVKDLFNRDQYKFGTLLNSHRIITLDNERKGADGESERDMRTGVKAVLIKSGAEGQNVVGTICGRKVGVVCWHCDEAPFMDVGILEARVNLFSNEQAHYWASGNAPSEGDPLYIDAEPYGPKYPDGWRSVDKDVNEYWSTRTGICLYFNGAKSPNMRVPRGRRPPFTRLMDWQKRDEILRMSGGEDTPIFWKQFYGFPPTVDVPDKIVTHKLLEENGAFKAPEWDGSKIITLAGLDLGFREDGDPCVIDFGRLGKDVRGKTILAHEREAIVLHPQQSLKESFEAQIAKQVILKCRERDCHSLALDVTGDGGMILQAIEREAREQEYRLDVLPVSFSGSAEDRIVIPGEKRKAREMFDRMVSQLWAAYRLSAQNGVIRGAGEHSKAVQQLCSRKFSTDDKKRFSVESKREMKKRLKHSPDHGDARALLNFLALRHGLSGYSATTPRSSSTESSEAESRPVPYSGHSRAPAYAGR